MRHGTNVINIFSEPTPRIDGRQFGSGGLSGGGGIGPLNAELMTEDGTELIETESGQAIETEQ